MKHYMFCTDDKHLDTIENEGHISYNVRRSIQLEWIRWMRWLWRQSMRLLPMV